MFNEGGVTCDMADTALTVRQPVPGPRMCAGKVRHETALEAGKEAERLYQVKGDWVRVYRCPICGAYHCGH